MANPDPEAPAGPSAQELADRLARARRQPADVLPTGFYEQARESLRHPDSGVRAEAVRFLGRHFQKRTEAMVLLEMVVLDSSSLVRRLAADCLGGIFRATRDRRVNEVLGSVAKNVEEDRDVRAAAYAAIRRINGH